MPLLGSVRYQGRYATSIMAAELPERKIDYRQEAERIRATARDTQDAEVRAQLLLVASLYDRLSEHLPLAPHLNGSGKPRKAPTE